MDNINRIIAVDDEDMILEIYKQSLCPEEYSNFEESEIENLKAKLFGKKIESGKDKTFDLTLCNQGNDAIESVNRAIKENRPYSVAFIDVRMPPGIDGITTAEKIRFLDPYIEIVIVTAYSDIHPVDIAERIRPTHRLLYIQKPFNPQEIVQFASSLGEKWKIDRELRIIHKNLETGVKERTIELTRANELLKKEISERKIIEDNLAHEKELLSITMSSIGDGVISTDIEGKILLFNREAEDLTGLAKDFVSDKYLFDVLNFIDEKTKKNITHFLDNIRKSKETLFNENIILKSEKRQFLIEAEMSPIFDRNSEMTGFVIVFRDITEKRRIEEERIRMEKLESIGVLAGGIAHDFNNILGAIMGNIAILKMKISPEDPLFIRLERAEKASIRAKSLTHQLLTFAKGGLPIKEANSLADLIHETANFVLTGSNVIFEDSIPEDLWPIIFDANQLSQVMNNLFINSIQSMPDGGKIRVYAENVLLEEKSKVPLPFGRYIKIAVRDTGKGIPGDLLNRIFDPYFTTKETGTGLGLATSYSIIKKHLGYITVESEVGEGTTFYIYLPVKDTKNIEKYNKEEEIYYGTGKILLMDDEDDILDVAREILLGLGYEVEISRDGYEAIELYKKSLEEENPFKAVIMDLTVPGGMGGKEAIKELIKLNPNIKSVVSSGYSFDSIMSSYREFGFKGILGKPYRIEEVSKVLYKLFNYDK